MNGISCPKCGTPLSLHLRDSVYCVCSACRSGIDVQKREAVRMVARKQVNGISGIPLGAKAELLGKPYTVIGRLCYEGSDDEDVWQWEELMLTDGTHRHWLEYEPEIPQFTLFSEIPNGPLPADAEQIDPEETGKLRWTEGELPWVPMTNEVCRYTSYKIDGGKKIYSIERDVDGEEHFSGVIIPVQDVCKAFGMQLPAAISSMVAGSRRITSIIGMVGIIGFMGSSTVFSVVAPFLSTVKHRMTFRACPATSTLVQSEDCVYPGDVIGPFSLEETRKTYALRLTGNVFAQGREFTFSFVPPSAVRDIAERGRVYVPVQDTSLPTGLYHGQKYFFLTEPGERFLHVQSTPSTTQIITVEIAEAPLGRWLTSIFEVMGSF